MLVFASEDRPIRDDRPTLKADGQTILFRDPLRLDDPMQGYRVCFAEHGHGPDVARTVFDYMQRRAAIAAER